ncbi:MAG: Fur family transcriptional regulator [Candidatus Neomarinimicrobiota bacterium]
MRRSKQRDTILKAVRGTDRHPTAEWIFDQVRREIPNISLGTVYRNLNQLADGNLLRRIFDNGFVRYDGNPVRHDHFRCVRCHRIFDIHVPLEGIAEAITKDGKFKVTGYSLEVTGECPECQLETNER